MCQKCGIQSICGVFNWKTATCFGLKTDFYCMNNYGKVIGSLLSFGKKRAMTWKLFWG